MSLQRSPLNQQPSNVLSMNRRQPQERRRTLQTISELSVADGASSKTKTSVKPDYTRRSSYTDSIVAEGQAPNLRRRSSLPGYCSNPGCLHAQTAYIRGTMQYSQSKQTMPDVDAGSHQTYNAVRERVRFHREQPRSDDKVLIDNHQMILNRAPLPARQTSLPYLRPYASQPQLSHNNHHISGFSRTIDTPPNPGSFSRHVYGNKLLERANTDLSSYHFTRSPAAQNPRYGILSPSVPYHPALPMRNQRYYTNPAASYNQPIPWKAATPVNLRSAAVRRSSSLPAIRVGHVRDMSYKHKQAMPRSFKIPDEERVVDIQNERLAALAALTGSDIRSLQKRRASTPTTMSVPTYASSSPLRQRRQTSTRTRTRFSPNVRVVPLNDTMKSKSSDNLLNHQTGPKRSRVRASLEMLGVPRQKSSGEGQTEKKKSRGDVDAMRRAEMADRVKWANERERERERELESLGKGSETGTGTEAGTETSEKREKNRGCLRGVLAMFGRKSKG